MKAWQWDDEKSITLTRYAVALFLLGAAALCLPAGLLVYLPFAFLAAAAAFMALIVRVVKNAFEQAVKMKNEPDYTI